ncbi:MAG: glycerate kinase [Chloroflexi bacterium]|nr:glycerate kinase [Chloroflexota bacterium]
MRIVIAPQEFKGTLTAREAVRAMAEGAAKALAGADIVEVPLSDGGPGLLEVVLTAKDGRAQTTTVRDPLGRNVNAEWGLLADGSSVIEMAAAAGLWRVSENERDPSSATTYGVGQLILEALGHSCRRIVVGLGGSATNDGGAGMAAALGARFLDGAGGMLPPGGGSLARLNRIEVSGLDRRLSEVEVIAATDVRNPLCGPNGSSLVYGKQKGASPGQAAELDAALEHYATIVEHDLGIRVIEAPGAGAAGGLGAGLIAFAGAEIRSGFDVVAEIVGLRERIEGADLVLTGEGRLDGQTGFGKTVSGVVELANESSVPVLVIPGSLGDGWEALSSDVNAIEPVVGELATMEEAMARPSETLALAVRRAVARWRRRS